MLIIYQSDILRVKNVFYFLFFSLPKKTKIANVEEMEKKKKEKRNEDVP